MSKRTKIILFSLLTLLFLIAAPLAVLYSQGYRYDFENRRIVQVGGLYLKIFPTSAEVYIDQKLVKKTNFLLDSVLIQDLLPKSYKIEVKKEGYFTWEKNLTIERKQVLEVKNITLIPENPSFNLLYGKVEDIWLLPNNKKIVFKEVDELGWSLKLFDLEKEIKSSLIKDKEISRFESELLDLKLSADSKRILLKLGLKEQIKYFIVDLSRPTATLISLDFLSPITEAVTFDPQNSLKIFFLEGEKFYQTDLTTRQRSLLSEEILVYQTSGKDLYYFNGSGHLYSSDLAMQSEKKLSVLPFILETEINHNLEILNDHIFLKEGGIVYYFNPSSKSFTELAKSVNLLRISPDNKKIVYANDYELWVYFLEDTQEQPAREVNVSLFLTRFSEKISQVFWLNSHYLVFSNGNNIKVAEIDDRDKINIYDLAEFKEAQFLFSSDDKKLYLLSKGILYQSEEITK